MEEACCICPKPNADAITPSISSGPSIVMAVKPSPSSLLTSIENSPPPSLPCHAPTNANQAAKQCSVHVSHARTMY
eukprot:3725259-Amphidinium_carterae.1